MHRGRGQAGSDAQARLPQRSRRVRRRYHRTHSAHAGLLAGHSSTRACAPPSAASNCGEASRARGSTVRFHRISSTDPEVFYIAFGFPVQGVMPVFSGGGVPFTPYTDQLEGSCRDYYAIDGWAHYPTPFGEWLWVTRDAALVSVGGPHTVERRRAAPDDKHRLLAMVFDNFWHTNFVADSHGEMEFQFELVWRDKIENPERLAETLASDAVVLVNPATRESPELLNDLFRP